MLNHARAMGSRGQVPLARSQKTFTSGSRFHSDFQPTSTRELRPRGNKAEDQTEATAEADACPKHSDDRTTAAEFQEAVVGIEKTSHQSASQTEFRTVYD